MKSASVSSEKAVDKLLFHNSADITAKLTKTMLKDKEKPLSVKPIATAPTERMVQYYVLFLTVKKLLIQKSESMRISGERDFVLPKYNETKK